MAVSKQKMDKDLEIRALGKKMNVDFGGWIFRWDLYQDGDGHGYEPSYPIDDVFSVLNISSEDCIVDLGCGKGYAIYLLSKYNFKKIDGVEKNTPLSNIARNNMSVLFPCSKRIHIYNQDVNEWQEFSKYNFFYMCNPFGKDTTYMTAHKIKESAEKNKHRVTVVYQMGEYIDAFISIGFRETIRTEKNCVLVFEGN